MLMEVDKEIGMIYNWEEEKIIDKKLMKMLK